MRRSGGPWGFPRTAPAADAVPNLFCGKGGSLKASALRIIRVLETAGPKSTIARQTRSVRNAFVATAMWGSADSFECMRPRRGLTQCGPSPRPWPSCEISDQFRSGVSHENAYIFQGLAFGTRIVQYCKIQPWRFFSYSGESVDIKSWRGEGAQSRHHPKGLFGELSVPLCSNYAATPRPLQGLSTVVPLGEFDEAKAHCGRRPGQVSRMSPIVRTLPTEDASVAAAIWGSADPLEQCTGDAG